MRETTAKAETDDAGSDIDIQRNNKSSVTQKTGENKQPTLALTQVSAQQRLSNSVATQKSSPTPRRLSPFRTPVILAYRSGGYVYPPGPYVTSQSHPGYPYASGPYPTSQYPPGQHGTGHPDAFNIHYPQDQQPPPASTAAARKSNQQSQLPTTTPPPGVAPQGYQYYYVMGHPLQPVVYVEEGRQTSNMTLCLYGLLAYLCCCCPFCWPIHVMTPMF